MTSFLRWLTLTHSVRWHKHYHSTGSGHVYQNRFKAFPIARDEHLWTVLRYVERNALRAGFVKRAEEWMWSSTALRSEGSEAAAKRLHSGPMPLPGNWLEVVNKPQTDRELEALRRSVVRGTPYGSESWVKAVVKRLGLQSTIRPRGRPKKAKTKGKL
jgi:putative transposase